VTSTAVLVTLLLGLSLHAAWQVLSILSFAQINSVTATQLDRQFNTLSSLGQSLLLVGIGLIAALWLHVLRSARGISLSRHSLALLQGLLMFFALVFITAFLTINVLRERIADFISTISTMILLVYDSLITVVTYFASRQLKRVILNARQSRHPTVPGSDTAILDREADLLERIGSTGRAVSQGMGINVIGVCMWWLGSEEMLRSSIVLYLGKLLVYLSNAGLAWSIIAYVERTFMSGCAAAAAASAAQTVSERCSSQCRVSNRSDLPSRRVSSKSKSGRSIKSFRFVGSWQTHDVYDGCMLMQHPRYAGGRESRKECQVTFATP